MVKSIIKEKSIKFAFKVTDLTKELFKKKEFILSRQIMRSGTSIGANVEEALASYSKKDFLYKMNIAYKEARETLYWLKVLNYQYKISKILFSDIKEINKILATIVLRKKRELNMLNK